MKQSNATSEPASDEMSIQPPEQLSEAEYLDQEIRLARRAMGHAQARIKEDARRLADPRLWIQSYPLACTVAACAAGALLARGAKQKAARERPDAQASASNINADGRGSSLFRDLGESFRKNLVRLLTGGLMDQAMNAFRSYVNPEPAYSDYDPAPEPAEADAGGNI